MYWFRTESAFSVVIWIAAAILWGVGGWLLVRSLFDIEKRERVLLGFGVGLTLYLWLLNMSTRIFSPEFAFFLPAILVLVFGVITHLIVKPGHMDLSELNIWPEWITLGILCIFFTLIGRGLGIFDEPKNLSIISLMARGQVPPKYYLDGQLEHAYHYGSQLLGASLMRLGGFFPWSAFDISKAIYWAYLILLVYIFLKRWLQNTWKAVIGTSIFPLLSGTRYLLALLPAQLMQQINPVIEFEGVSTDLQANLSQSLGMTWSIAGGPPGGYPFAFLNSFHQPFIMAHAGTWTYAFVLVLLIWMLGDRLKNVGGILILTIVLSTLALVWESTYVMIVVTAGIVFINDAVKKKHSLNIKHYSLIFAILTSIPIALIQGGVLYSFLGKILSLFTGIASDVADPVGRGSNLFSFRWPPGIFSNHFGALLITSLPQMIVALFEIGPVILFVPMINRTLTQENKTHANSGQIVVISALIAFLLPIFISYDRSPRDITRFTNYATSIWNLGLILVIFSLKFPKKVLLRVFWIIVPIICSIGGLMLFIVQLKSISNPIIADGIDGLDARISIVSWEKLEANSFILDPGRFRWRATMITGCYTIAEHFYSTLNKWEELQKSPEIPKILDSGFRYIYIDETWWRFLDDKFKPQFNQECVRVIASEEDNSGLKFRRLLDLSDCAFP